MGAVRRLDADRAPVVVLTILFGVTIAGASFVLSFHGLRDVATWGRVPEWLAWLVPVMIDAAVLCYTLAWLVQRARRESVWLSWCALALFTAVSTLGNTLHGWEPSEAIQRIVGTAVVGLAPLAMLLATHTLAQLLTERVPRADAPASELIPFATHADPPVTAPTAVVTRVIDLGAAREAFADRQPTRPPRGRRRRKTRTADSAALAVKVRELHDAGDSFKVVASKLQIPKSTAHFLYQGAQA